MGRFLNFILVLIITGLPARLPEAIAQGPTHIEARSLLRLSNVIVRRLAWLNEPTI